MKTAVLGTGSVGRTIAARLSELGHAVTIGTRDPEATLSRTAADAMGTPPFATWAADNPGVGVASFADAVVGAELIVNATSGGASLEVLGQVGAENLDGKVILDIANPLDFSNGMPPTLFVKDTDSLGEQIQRAFPEARVVKALNTMNCIVMVDPEALPGDHVLYLCGDDEGAKDDVRALLRRFGWRDTSIVDLGGIDNARATEMYLPLWVRLRRLLGTPAFNLALVRAD